MNYLHLLLVSESTFEGTQMEISKLLTMLTLGAHNKPQENPPSSDIWLQEIASLVSVTFEEI